MPRTPKNPLFTKFVDLKGAVFCVGFGEAKLIRLTPMSANEPKNAEKPPFKADLGLNTLAKQLLIFYIKNAIMSSTAYLHNNAMR